MVSSSWSHKAQAASGCKPCCFLRSAVHSRPCRASQKKNLIFGGTVAHQSSLALAMRVQPTK